jgi:hypothetical protein
MCALGAVRGLLYSISTGEYEPEQTDFILKGTTLANIAAAIGERESDLAIDWDDHLTPTESLKIAGWK